jgi:hypothetical protein
MRVASPRADRRCVEMRRRCILRRLGLIQGEEKGKTIHRRVEAPAIYIQGASRWARCQEREKERKREKSAEEPVRRDTRSGERGRLTNRRRDLLGDSQSGVPGEQVVEPIGGDIGMRDGW